MTRRWLGLGSLLLLLALAGAWLLRSMEDTAQGSMNGVAAQAAGDALQRGEYLARAGNCRHCHTQRGGASYAGGRALETPFGTVYSSNLTPDSGTGIGLWSAQDFWQALHQGRSRDGHWLLPAFPYGNFTFVSRADSDALYAFLRSVPAVLQANRSHALAWPFNSQWALGLWRGLFFRAQEFLPDASRSADWNRGAYLVQGLGHCSACHAQRNALGASGDATALAGGMIAVQDWYAPSLAARPVNGAPQRETEETVQLLHSGISAHAAVSGPMADVVLHSTQYLEPSDLQAMVRYLKDLPSGPDANLPVRNAEKPDPGANPAGARLYREHCAQCHGDEGQGVALAYPALAGSAAVNLASPVNLVQIVLNGGFAPATGANPRPFGMPPFALSLSDHEIAAVLSFVRTAWGNRAAEVTPHDVDRLRGHAR